MAQQLILKARKRTDYGGGKATRLRKQGAVPAILYSGGAAAQPVQVDAHDFGLILQRHGENMIMALTLEDGEPIPVLIKEVQHHPVSGNLLHTDFQQISLSEKIKTRVQIDLVGAAAGVKLGGILDQSLFDLEIEGLPGDVPESIEVDVTDMVIGDHLTVADLTLPSGIEAVTEPDITVASVLAPRTETETSESESGEAEPEVIGAKKDATEEES